jgi:hypothetical protein
MAIGLTFTAVNPGVGGNAISINILATHAANQTLTITVVGSAISVLLATDGAGVSTTTVQQLLTAFAASAAARALVTASAPGLALGSTVNFGCGAQFLAGGAGTGYCGLDKGNYKILLYDTNGIQISNIPLLFSNLFHVPAEAAVAGGLDTNYPRNYWPTPAMLYRVQTSIRFQLYVTSSTPTTGPVNFDIMFSGVRRYPCH